MPGLPPTMRAVEARAFGPPQELVAVTLPVPEPGPDDILVRVRASGVNPIEWKMRSGAMAKAIVRDLPVVSSWACAGEVAAVGAAATAHRVGDAVYSYPAFARGGTHAEYVAIAAGQVAAKPARLCWAGSVASCWPRSIPFSLLPLTSTSRAVSPEAAPGRSILRS